MPKTDERKTAEALKKMLSALANTGLFLESKYDYNDSISRMMPAIVILDLGNNSLKYTAYIPHVSVSQDGLPEMVRLHIDGKQISVPHIWVEEICGSIPHAYFSLSTYLWEKEVQSASSLSRSRARSTHSFQLVIDKQSDERVAYKIGAGVFQNENFQRWLGSKKYFKGGIDALMNAVFLEIFDDERFPKGHNNIIAGIGHPPTAWMHANEILNIISGTHYVETAAGDKKRFHVTAAIPFDEAIGGLFRFLAREKESVQPRVDGKFAKKAYTLEEGDEIILLDAGGFVGSMSKGTINGVGDNLGVELDLDNVVEIDGGAITVRRSLREAMRTAFPDLTKYMSEDSLSDKTLNKIINSKEWVIRGDKDNPIDMTEVVDQSLVYMRKISDAYDRFSRGINASHILMTGGTVHDLYDQIREELQPHASIITVDDLKNIYMANVLGGATIIASRLHEEMLTPIAFQVAQEIDRAKYS